MVHNLIIVHKNPEMVQNGAVNSGWIELLNMNHFIRYSHNIMKPYEMVFRRPSGVHARMRSLKMHMHIYASDVKIFIRYFICRC